nr:MAG TPA: minor tail protein [Caudoviricetes sp.]
MGASVGEIDLDLHVNRNGFDREMQGIQGLAKKAGAALAGAFAVKKLVDFGKSCIELGSDLEEVQNVVDVTFPHMTAQVDKFAKEAAASFGLSETMAKKFTGTFGAMAKSFGFSEKAAYDMGSTLTGLAGDVASFYNISQDEAYTKLKSVFTGETETLKDLGIVMTQNALDAYAMANGYGKVTKDMSEAEKVALRYAFVQSQLTAATGDFARTSGSWANQVRLLSLQFESLKATIGQGLINLFTPIIKAVNVLLGKLATLANAFKAFTELITGNHGSASSNNGIQETANAANEAQQGLGGATGAANNLKKATDGAGKAAKKAAKEMQGLSGIDKLNNLTTTGDKGSDGSGGKGSGSGGVGDSAVDYGKLNDGENVIDKQVNKFQALINRVKELAGLFAKGFKIGLGDTAVLQDIQDSLNSIRNSIVEIFSDPNVLKAGNQFLNSLSLNMGKVAGSFASVGLTIADNILGGMSKYLEQNKNRIKGYLVSMFEIGSETANIIGDFSVVLADIATVFRSDTAKQITADIISIFSNSFMGISEISAKGTRDFLKAITDPIAKNKDKIKDTIQGMFEAVEPVFRALSDIVTNTFEKWNEVYDQYVSPAWEKFSSGLDKILSITLDAFNKYLLPLFKKIGKEFKQLAEKHIQPLINAFLELCGKATDALATLWNFLSPFVGWFIEKFIAKMATKIEWFWTKVKAVVSIISDLLKGLCDYLSGFIDFITGVFTGDWGRAWDGIKEMYRSIWETMKNIVGDALTFIKDTIITGFNAVKAVIEVIWDGIKLVFSTVWEEIKRIFEPVGDWFKGKFVEAYKGITTAFQNIGEWASDRWKAVTKVFQDVKNWFGQRFKDAYTNLTNAFSAIGTWASEKWRNVTDVFKGVGGWFQEKFDAAYRKVTKAFSGTGKFFSGVWSNIKGAFGNIIDWFRDNFSKAWEAVKKVFSSGGKVFTGIKEGILKGLKDVINALIDGINRVISVPFKGIQTALNKVKGFEVAGGHPFGGLPTIDTPQIPRLAQGGFVKKNTPQLALIGDNRHQGEVVAPENKLQDLLNQAVKQSNSSDVSMLVPMMKEMIGILKMIYGKEYVASVSSNDVYKAWETEKKKVEKRTGKSIW